MKRIYHPSILIAYYLQCLPEHIRQQIPRTTIHEWKQKDDSLHFGYDWYIQNKQLFAALQYVSQSNRLLRINLALIRIIAIKKFITKYTPKPRETPASILLVIQVNIDKVRTVFGTIKTLSYLDIPYSIYLKWKNNQKCRHSLLSLCTIKHPLQLLHKEVQSIYSYCMNERFQFWPLASVYFQMLKEKATVVSLSTFYKYVGLLKLRRKEIKKPKQSVGIRADACYKILHADITILKTADNIKAYVYLIQDNFSRGILSYRISLEKKAVYTLENIRFAYDNYLKPLRIDSTILLTDDGCENYGVVNTFIAGTSIKHLIAQQDIHFSNSMIEAANKQLKYRYLYHKNIPSFNELDVYIKEAVNDFNNRPHAVLKGLTPLEMLSGESSSVITAAEIEKAKIDRIIENKKLQCCYSF